MTLCAFPVIIQLDFEMFLIFFWFLVLTQNGNALKKQEEENPRRCL
jgi:hypothetical protein